MLRSDAPRFDLDGFKAAFAPLAAQLNMRWQLTSGARLPRVALFCSQYLHCMADLLHRWRSASWPARFRSSSPTIAP